MMPSQQRYRMKQKGRKELFVLGFDAVESNKRKEMDRRKLAEEAADDIISRNAVMPIQSCEPLPSDVASINAGQMSGVNSRFCHELSF
jgi:hypothetical protein